MSIEIISDTENKLLSRRELTLNFKGGNGGITRQSAAEAIANRFGARKEMVRVLSLQGRFGLRDLNARAYIYSDPKVIDKQLPKYLAMRDLPKEERKKAREALKAKAAAAAAPAAKS